MDAIAIYSPATSNRLQYVLDWLFKRLGLKYTIYNDEGDVSARAFLVSYGKQLPGSIMIPDTGLLWEKDVHKHDSRIAKWQEIPVLYAQGEGVDSIPFDLFSAIFFLLSRYEEYYPFTPDKHERYPATESILYKNGWLQRPLVDEWVYAFGKLLQEHGVTINVPEFKYLPTYDIDIAYAYLNKGFTHGAGTLAKNILKGKPGLVAEQLRTLAGGKNDPFDSFEKLQKLHEQTGASPIYFILSALKKTRFDRNISPEYKPMKALIQQINRHATTGIHPSYYSDSNGVMKNEKRVLQAITGKSIDTSRQHYIKVKLPDTYRLLISNGIKTDYSIGYGTHLGFRAGTGMPFYWYDVAEDKATDLLIYPFCFMDTTAHYEEQLSPEKAFEVLNKMNAILKRTHSMLITIFHNFSLGSNKEWTGWWPLYDAFVKANA